MSEKTESVVSLDKTGLDHLERRLMMEMAKMSPKGVAQHGGDDLLEGNALVGSDSDRSELEKARTDILDFYRTGVRIARHAESRPLFPLYQAKKVAVPAEFQVDAEQLGYQFYIVEVAFHLMLENDQFPASAKLDLWISDDVQEPERKTRPVRLFPSRHDKSYFKADIEGGVGLNVGMDFEVPLEGVTAIPFSKLKGDASIKADFLIGPFEFQLRRAAITVVGDSDPHIVWQYKLKSELTGKNQFKSILVLKVAGEATDLNAQVRLEVVPCKRKWLLFRDMLPPISDQANLKIELAKGD